MANVEAGIEYLNRVSKFAVAEHKEIYAVCQGMLEAMREPVYIATCEKHGDVHCHCQTLSAKKDTIEIDKEIAWKWYFGKDYDGEMGDAVKRALAKNGGK